MTRQQKPVHKKVGRPPGRIYGETIPVRLAPEMISAVDRWAEAKSISRSEAIRAMIDQVLKRK